MPPKRKSAGSQPMEGVSDHRDARRPMNSFFIFCKRHRSMVRDHHQSLDNRSISRILGELWAKLDPKEKQQYTTTAKQYKDAFLKANPDYKWHNNDKSHLMATGNFAMNQELGEELSEKNHEKVERHSENPASGNNMDVLWMAIQQDSKDFATEMFKENTNGSLIEGAAAAESSLISRKDVIHTSTPIKQEPGNVNANIEYAMKQGWACEDESSIETPINKCPEYPAEEPMPSTSGHPYTFKNGNESEGSKSHQSDASGDVNCTKNNSNEKCRRPEYRGVNLPTRKSKRANKGSIYKSLIATGMLPASRERLAEMKTIYDVNPVERDDVSYEQSVRRVKRTTSESETHSDKRYKTGDFDLDAKIATLPACSMDVLEKNRKSATKPKSSPENSRRPSGNPVVKTDMLLTPPHRRQRRPLTSPVKGCRKRKPHQGNILRLVKFPGEVKHPLAHLMEIPLTQFYLHPTMKSYHDYFVPKPASSSVASTSRDCASSSQAVASTSRDPTSSSESVVSSSRDHILSSHAIASSSRDRAISSPDWALSSPDRVSFASSSPDHVSLTSSSPDRISSIISSPDRVSSILEPASPTLAESFESKDNNPIATKVKPCSNQKAIRTGVPIITATSALTMPTATKNPATSNSVMSIGEKPIFHLATIKAGCKSAVAVPKPKCSVFATPPMPNLYQASVSSVDISLRSTQVTDISAQLTAARTSNIPLAAVAAAAAVSEPMPAPSPLDLSTASSGLHVSGELKVKLGNQSPKQSKLSETDFKIWISTLAEAAERTGQISVY